MGLTAMKSARRNVGDNRGQRDRLPHPWLFGLAIIVAGAGLVALLAEANHPTGSATASAEPTGTDNTALALGQTVAKTEKAALDLGTNRVYRFRASHPGIYGLVAFILGSGVVALFILLTYLKSTFESPDLKVAMYDLVFGGLGGGIAAVLLAFAYTSSIRATLEPMKAGGVIGSAGSGLPPLQAAAE
jgi:hypothetical protein